MPDDQHDLEARTLWRVEGFDAVGEYQQPGSRYGWDNRPRKPVDIVVFQLTTRGSMRYRDARGERVVPVGCAALFAFGEDSAYRLSPEDREGYECVFANFAGAGLREHWDALRARHGPVVRIDDGTLRGFRRLLALAEPSARTDPLAMARAVSEFVLDLMRALSQRLVRRQPPVERAIDELLRRPTQPFALKEVAERFGCSREHLTRVFTERVGVPPASWLTTQRVAKALQLLRESDLPIRAVAEQAGFASAHTLARQIREATGRSPRAWRRGG